MGDDRRWSFKCFTADSLDEADEARVVGEWLTHIRAVNAAVLGADEPLAPILHWSGAETSSLSAAYNSVTKRHPDLEMPPLPWYDLLERVVRARPVVVKGALGFGLKAFAKAMHAHGLIETCWSDGPADGLGAMVGAMWVARQAAERGVPMREFQLMREIESYNEVDCKVMWEITSVLRSLFAHRGQGSYDTPCKRR